MDNEDPKISEIRRLHFFQWHWGEETKPSLIKHSLFTAKLKRAELLYIGLKK